jgi:hypothetical protein
VNYFEIVPYAFKKFSVLRALRTGVPTALYHAHRTSLPVSEKPALFTMNIMPPMMTVWYHLVQKNLGDRVDTTIFDCSGTLKKSQFPNARVQKYLNLYAATKSDEFLYHIAKNRKIGWVCDDDMFILNSKAIDLVEQSLSKPNAATFSFRPRDWWHFNIDGKEYAPSSSYCIAFNREIYCDKEKLSLSPCEGNTNAVSHIGKPVSRYDTFDKANESLINKGYTCDILPVEKQGEYVIGYSGMSTAVMMIWHFRRPEQMIDYLEAPKAEAWKGNTLFTVLSGLLAIADLQDMHQKITGKPYNLRSMPTKKDLDRLRTKYEPLLREGKSFDTVSAVSEVLNAAL